MNLIGLLDLELRLLKDDDLDLDDIEDLDDILLLEVGLE